MVEATILKSAKAYLAALKAQGVEVECVVIYGSHATGSVHAWSDIDLLIVAPEFDDMRNRSGINLLWRLAARVDNRIEPTPCGSRQWREDDSSAIIEIARRQGKILKAA